MARRIETFGCTVAVRPGTPPTRAAIESALAALGIRAVRWAIVEVEAAGVKVEGARWSA